MRLGYAEVVRLDRDGVENRGDESLAVGSPSFLRQLDADLQLRHGDRSHRDIITVVDHLTQ